jgi:hypothetical protein
MIPPGATCLIPAADFEFALEDVQGFIFVVVSM